MSNWASLLRQALLLHYLRGDESPFAAIDDPEREPREPLSLGDLRRVIRENPGGEMLGGAEDEPHVPQAFHEDENLRFRCEKLLIQLIRDVGRKALASRTQVTTYLLDGRGLVRAFLDANDDKLGEIATDPEIEQWFVFKVCEIADEGSAIDFYLAHEFVDRLGDAENRRLGWLAEITVDRMPGPRVQRQFEQAVLCYLFGFDNACVVFCGALIEAVLNDKIVVPGDPNANHIRRAEYAVETGRLPHDLLTDTREIWRYRNDLIHPNEANVPDVKDVLMKSRLIVESLCQQDTAARA